MLSRRSAVVGGPYSNCMCLCARMLARDRSGDAEQGWTHAVAANNRLEPPLRSSQFTEDPRFPTARANRARVHSPPVLAATHKADAFRNDRLGWGRVCQVVEEFSASSAGVLT